MVNLFLATIFDEFLLQRSALEAADQSSASHDSAGGIDYREVYGDNPSPASSSSPVVGHGRPANDAEGAFLIPEAAFRSDGGDELSALGGGWTRKPSGGGRERACLPAALGRLRSWLRGVVDSSALSYGSMALVLLNVVVMCLPYDGMSADYAHSLESTGKVLTLAFAVEMGLKLCALGWGGYWGDRWNVLDGTIVTFSVVELAVEVALASTGLPLQLSYLRMLRILRVMRMLRLMRKWRRLHMVISSFLLALQQMRNLLILMVLLMSIFSLLGMQARAPFPSPARPTCSPSLFPHPPFRSPALPTTPPCPSPPSETSFPPPL